MKSNGNLYCISYIVSISNVISIDAKVQFDSAQGVNRETVAKNRELVHLTLNHLGTRMSVGTIEVHIRAFYDLMHLNIGSTFPKSMISECCGNDNGLSLKQFCFHISAIHLKKIINPYPHHCSGPMIVSQAWALRRMISVYNAMLRRPHVPRDRALRLLMRDQGLDVEVDPPAISTSASGSELAPVADGDHEDGPPGDDDADGESSDSTSSGAPAEIDEDALESEESECGENHHDDTPVGLLSEERSFKTIHDHPCMYKWINFLD